MGNKIGFLEESAGQKSWTRLMCTGIVMAGLVAVLIALLAPFITKTPIVINNELVWINGNFDWNIAAFALSLIGSGLAGKVSQKALEKPSDKVNN